MSVINVTCTDQDLTITSAPQISSGGVNTDSLKCTFSELWNGFTKYAVFFKNDFLAYRVPLDSDGQCLIPNVVLAEPGVMRFGVFGVKDAARRTSVVLEYPILEGSYSKVSETATASVTGLSDELIADIIAEVTRANGYNLTVIDSSVSATSVNPVQNKVLKAYIDSKVGSGGGSGVGVTGAEIDGNGHLIITLSDTSTIDAGTAKGANGTTFIPAVSTAGVLTWTNDGGMENPSPVMINGVSVTNATINSSGHLIITLSNGNTIDAGLVTSGAGATDSGWQVLPLSDGVTVADTDFAVTPQYRKIGNHVFIKGHVKCSVPSGGILIGVLPEAYRLPHGTHYDIGECGGQRVSRIYADANGNLKCEWIQNIAGGAFTNETWIQIDMDYLVD